MSSKSRFTEAHDYYYLGVDEGRCKRYAGVELHYDGRTAYSYSTAIARVIPLKGFKDADVTTMRSSNGLTLLSVDSMSSCTCKHIQALKEASPFDVLRVPFRFGNEYFDPSILRDNYLHDLGHYALHLNHVDERTKFVRLMESRKRLLDEAAEEWARPLRDRRFKEFEDILGNLEDWRKNLKKKLAEKAAKEEAAAKRMVSRYTRQAKTAQGYLNLVRALFCWGEEARRMKPETKTALKAAFTKSGESYVWVAGDEIVTSQHVHVGLKGARVLLKAWAAGKDMRTLKVDNYSIVSYTGDTIQIGCHRIPRKNMLALYEVVTGKKFPERNSDGCKDKA